MIQKLFKQVSNKEMVARLVPMLCAAFELYVEVSATGWTTINMIKCIMLMADLHKITMNSLKKSKDENQQK